MTRPLLLVAVVGCLLAAPAVCQDEPPRDPPPQPSFPELPESAPAGTGILQPCMEELEGEVRCGRYRVWENRAEKSGRTLDLGFVVAEALDPHSPHSDAVTYFFGGPGSQVTAASPFAIQFARAFREKRDLLFLDFRGVGASQALDCDVAYPRGVESRFGEIFPVDHVAACRDKLSERADLELYTSAANMDDLEELRRWLNYSALNLDGASYGTHEIQVFLRRHPKSARTVVLNGVSPIFGEGYVSHARQLQRALDELVRECLADEACGAAFPNLATTLEAVLERVRADPPEVEAEGQRVRLGPGELGYALRGLLYGRGTEIPLMLDNAAKGDWQPLADYYLARSAWVAEDGGEAGMHFSVLCAEDVGRLDGETISRETEGTFLGDYLIGGYARVCEVWPYARLEPSFWEPVASDVPALLLSGTRDPVTPSGGGEAVGRHLPNSRHVVVEGGGHVVGGPCIDSIALQLVEAGSVESLDTSCIAEMPGTEFKVE